MAEASEVVPPVTIVHPKTGQLFDVVTIDSSSDDGKVRFTSLDGHSIKLEASAHVHVVRGAEPSFSALQAAATLAVFLGLAGLLVLIAILGAH